MAEKTPNGDGESKPALSTHIIEVVEEPIGWGEASGKSLSAQIEAAYIRLQDRAKADDSLIVSMVQTVTAYAVKDCAQTLIVLTAQRISLEELEKQRRMAQFGPPGGQHPGGPRR